MSLPGEIKRRIEMLFHRDQLNRDLEEEMRLHVELRRQQQMDRGLAPAEAARAAHVRFGNVARIKEESLMTWGSETLESLLRDVSYGVRALLRSPALTVVALVSLALGIGANTAIFSLLDAVLLRSLPVKDPQQLILLGTGDASGIGNNFVSSELYSYPFYRQLREKNAVFSEAAAILSMTNDVHGFVLNSPGEPTPDAQLMHVNLVSGTYFPMLGVQAQMGRTLNESDDDTEGDHPVVVVSQGFWKRALGSDPKVLERRIKLGTTIFTIVGVAPAEFFGTKVGESPDMWAPLSMTQAIPPGWKDAYNGDFVQSLNVMGRLKPGVSVAQATANVNLLVQQITRGFPDATLSQKNLALLAKTQVPLTPMANGLSAIRGSFSEPLKILMAVVALVLLIACANIANLLLARSTTRARELAVRQALGARRSRLIRQLLTESVLLALCGGAVGIAFALVANRFLLRMVSGGDDILPLDIGLNLRLLGFTFAVTVTTAILFGTLPAFRATRIQLTDSLKDGRGPSSAGSRNPLAKALIITQVALSLVLMVGAGLFLRSLVNLNHVDTGFNRENVLRLQVETDALNYKEDDPRLNALYKQIESRVSALPGVKAASFSAFTFNEGSWSGAMIVPGMPDNDGISVHQNVVGNDYFKTMEIPVIAGRTFTDADTAASQHVAVLSEHVAKTFFPPGNPIGRHFRIGQNKPEREYEVIGIVRDTKFGNLQEEQESISYLSYAQRPWGFGDFEVRYSGDFSSVAAAVQQVIKSVDSKVRVSHVTTLDEQIARSITNQRLVAQLSTFFGLLAVFLSAIGIYGLMSYVVSRRTNEIGIRMALGAARANVSWLVMREILLLVGLGIAIGIPAALAGERLVATMLYGLKGTDPLSMAAAVVLLILVGAAAGFFPARRASRVEPMQALRYE
jgi:predicted permease